MFITVIRLSNESETVTVYALHEETVDYSEYVYQEWITEGYTLDNQYTESLTGNINWKPDFIKFLAEQPTGIYVEHRTNKD